MELSSEQRAIVSFVRISSRDILVEGPAGSGKTACFRSAAVYTDGLEHFSPIGVHTSVAKRAVIGRYPIAITLYELFDLTPDIAEQHQYDVAWLVQYVREHGKTFMQYVVPQRVLYVEECFAVPLWQMQLLLYVRAEAEAYTGNNIQLILTGDASQCVPVGRESGGPYDPFAYFFEDSDIFGHFRHLKRFKLRRIHRQTDEKTVELMSAFRYGALAQHHIHWLQNQLCVNPADLKDRTDLTYLVSTHEEANEINTMKLDTIALADRLVIKAKGKCDDVRLVNELEIGIGCTVMYTCNGPGYARGSTGTVVAVNGYHGMNSDDPRHLLFIAEHNICEIKDIKHVDIQHSNGAVVRIVPRSLTVYNPLTYKEHTTTQLPIQIAYAVTINASQGMTLDNVAIDLSRVFAYGQAYTAMSRIRTLAGLIVLGYDTDKLQDRTMNVCSAVDCYYDTYSR